MKYRVLGTTGMMVSPICMGTMTFGRPLDEGQSKNLVGYALDQGINFFDTANVYEGYDRKVGSKGGVSEGFLGQAIVKRRQDVVICTKLGNPSGTGPLDAGLSAHHLELELDLSLKRLKTDWVDLVLAHRWHSEIPMEEVWRVFDRWVRAGKARAVGVSNWPTWRMAQASEIARRNGWPTVGVSSPKYSLMTRGIELDHVPCARHYGVGLVTYQALEGGALSGKYQRGQPPPAGSRGEEKPEWMPARDDVLMEKLDALQKLSQEAGMSVLEYVLAWTLSQQGISSVITGLRNRSQLDAAIAAAGKSIPPEHLSRIDAVFPRPKPVGGDQVLSWGDGGWVLEDIERPPFGP